MAFVSRGGEKLDHAIKAFSINVEGLVCADLGCSTGGFVDCLLQYGAAKVYAVDTGYGELDWNIRNDKRVVVMERTNALYATLPEPVDFISIDLGWTKQKFIIPHALTLVKQFGHIITLVKPHYEAEKADLMKGVLPVNKHQEIMDRVRTEIEKAGVEILAQTESPIAGKRGGNIEYLLLIKRIQDL